MVAKSSTSMTPNYESCPYFYALSVLGVFYFHSNYTFLLPNWFPECDALKAEPSLTLSLSQSVPLLVTIRKVAT
jgi:hypothetical protein